MAVSPGLDLVPKLLFLAVSWVQMTRMTNGSCFFALVKKASSHELDPSNMNPLVLSSAQKQAIRQSSPQAAGHFLCEITDDPFYFGNADEITGWIRDVLCIETFFGAMRDGGVVTWFDWDHGRVAHLVPSALDAVGLTAFASCAERALAIHSAPPYPATIEGWREEIERIRDVQLSDDFDSAIYGPIEDDFFSLYHSDPGHYRTKLHEYVLAHLDD